MADIQAVQWKKIRKFLSEKELAHRWDVSVDKLQNDRDKCRGVPWHKFGGSVRYMFEDVLSYEKASRVEPNQCGGTQ